MHRLNQIGVISDTSLMDARYNDAVSAAQGGAEWAWTSLYHWLSPTLLGYMRARGASEPEDALGEVWLQLARNMPTFQGDASAFRTWAFTIAHNRVVDDSRRRGRRPQSLPLEEHFDRAEVSVGFADAEHEALERLELEDLVSLTSNLSNTERSILLLRILGDLSVQQSAQIVGLSESAAKSAQYRAVMSMRKMLTPIATKSARSAVTG